MIGFVFWVLGMAAAIFLGLIVHLTPVLYHLCVFFERHLVLLVERSTGRNLTMGGLILASLLTWGAVGMLVGGLLFGSSFGIWPVVMIGSIAAAWGGSVGYQVGAQNLVLYYRRPGSIREHQPGYLGRQGQPLPRQSLDEFLREGVILGEADDD